MSKKKIIIIAIILVLITLLSSICFIPERIAIETTQEIWTTVNFVDQTAEYATENKLIDSTIYEDKLYIATAVSKELNNTETINKIYIQSFDGENWANVGEVITLETTQEFIRQMEFCNRTDGLYIFYSEIGLLKINKLDQVNNRWLEVTSITDTSGTFGLATENNLTYVTIINADQSIAKIYDFNGTTLAEEGVYFEDNGNIDEPKVAILNGDLYLGLSQAGKPKISIYKYTNGTVEKINSNINAYTYTMTAMQTDKGKKLYISDTSSSNGDMTIYTYNGYQWETIQTGLKYETHDPKMVIKSGEVYVVALYTNDKLQTYTYSRSTGEFVKQGDDVDDDARIAQAITYKDHIYTIYQDYDIHEIRVKRKEYKLDYYRGDINLDNRVTISDVIIGLQGLSEITTLTEEQRQAGDFNKDRTFRIGDIIGILKYLAEIEE